MNPHRSASTAIVAGLAAGAVTMFLHPTGQDVTRNATAGGGNALVTGLHALAIVAQPLIMCGMLALAARLGFGRALPVGALVFFALNSVLVVIEATASGFLAPMVVRGMETADAARTAQMLADLRFTGQLNRSIASVQVLLASIAILLYGLACLRDRSVSRAVGIVGVVVGIVLLLLPLSGHLSLGIHGYALVVAIQGVWFVLVAIELWRFGREER
jgi:hypothetical protein